MIPIIDMYKSFDVLGCKAHPMIISNSKDMIKILRCACQIQAPPLNPSLSECDWG